MDLKRTILLFLLGVCVISAWSSELSDRARHVTEAIYNISNINQNKFELTRDLKGEFYIFGNTLAELDEIACGDAVNLIIWSTSYDDSLGKRIVSPVGNIGIGKCNEHKEALLNTVSNASSAINTFMNAMLGGSAEASEEFKREFSYQEYKSGNNIRFHKFPVMAVGHGVFVAQTIVAVTENTGDIYIVQLDASSICNGNNPDYKVLCNDLKGSLQEIGVVLVSEVAGNR